MKKSVILLCTLIIVNIFSSCEQIIKPQCDNISTVNTDGIIKTNNDVITLQTPEVGSDCEVNSFKVTIEWADNYDKVNIKTMPYLNVQFGTKAGGQFQLPSPKVQEIKVGTSDAKRYVYEVIGVAANNETAPRIFTIKVSPYSGYKIVYPIKVSAEIEFPV